MRITAIMLLGTLIAVQPALAEEKKQQSKSEEQADKHAETKGQTEAAKKQQQIVQEATEAMKHTQEALAALDENNKQKAIQSLQKATGKLEIVMARDPDMKVVPFAMTVETQRLVGTPEKVDKMKKDIVQFIENDRVQDARTLMRALASETRISISSFPVATYPSALKEAARLIDQNKLDEARRTIGTALSTVVVAQSVVPLPVARADFFLTEAENMAKKKSPDQKQITANIESSRSSLRMAEELGYGGKQEYSKAYDQLDKIQEKVKEGDIAEVNFDEIQSTVATLYTQATEMQAQEE